jgi:hypothetical protein
MKGGSRDFQIAGIDGNTRFGNRETQIKVFIGLRL